MTKKTKEIKQDDTNVELENQLKRALADYANLQRRADEEKKTVVKFASAVVIAKFLDILDGLEASQKAHPNDGLELIIKKFKDILGSENVTEIVTDGAEFNPEMHEGIVTVPGEKDGQIAEVLQKGYLLDDKVLRPARVKVTASEKSEK